MGLGCGVTKFLDVLLHRHGYIIMYQVQLSRVGSEPEGFMQFSYPNGFSWHLKSFLLLFYPFLTYRVWIMGSNPEPHLGMPLIGLIRAKTVND